MALSFSDIQNKFLILTILLFLIACNMPEQKKEADTPSIVYEVFVQSFRDSNNDGIGDLQGLISKLDYIKELGANAVWIMPIHPSPSYHKYDVMDYYDVHPDYGTMKDMDELIAELHRRDMKLILDFVVNHTSALHPWFVEASTSDSNRYHGYYVWKNYELVRDEINKKTTTFDSDNITQWHPGKEEKEHYYGFFWKGMPDLNFDNPLVREEIFKIGQFWIDKGVDGFRLDAAKHIYPDDRFDDTRKFWEEFTERMRNFKPDIMIIGEVWSDPQILATLFKGLPSLFNFELTKAIPEVINTGDVRKFMMTYTTMSAVYKASDTLYEDAILLSNHDMNRIRSTLHGDLVKSKLAASILLTLPGTPYIYYGEEIGMLGVKPDQNIREPFLWGDENFKDTSWMQPVHSVPVAVEPLSKQMNDPVSIYHHYKTWIKIRKENPVFAAGDLEFVQTHVPNLLAYKITNGVDHVMTIHNLGNEVLEYAVPEKSKIMPEGIELNEKKIRIEPFSSVVIVPGN